MGSVCCFDYVLNGRRLWYDKIDHFPCICGQIKSTASWMREEFKPLNSARWFNSRLSWLLSFLLYVWCVWWRSTASWMREEGFSQAQGRTVITCTIDTTTLILWMCQDAAFGGRINLFSPTNHSLSPVRGDFSLSQLFCSLCVDVYGVYMLLWLRFEWQKAMIWQNRSHSCVWG